MKVLIFSAFDGVPYTDEEPMRYAAIAEEFLKNGHEVTYITASFSHLHKKYRTIQNPPEHLHIVLLPTKAYQSNFSIDRILSHYRLSFALSNWLDKQDGSNLPDIVIGASPPIFANYVLAKFCKKKNIPFIYDIQDLWPEEFVKFLPGKERLKFILKPYFSTAEKIVKMAFCVTAVSKDYLDYYSNEILDKPTKVFYLGTDVEKFKEASISQNRDNIISHNIIMLGNSQAGNYVTIAARAIQNLPNINLVIVGLKEKSSYYRRLIEKEKLLNVEVIEWINREEIYRILPNYDVGLILINPDSSSELPNRAFTYFAAGLPVISNIRDGELEQMIKNQNLGQTITVQVPSDLTSTIKNCIDNYPLKERKRIQQIARNNFSKNDIYHEYYSWVIANFETIGN